jgi:uncharacterized protein
MTLQRRMRSLPFSQIKLTDAFWTRWQRILRETTIPAEYEQIVQTGRLANFLRAGGREQGEHQGLFFNDSDVYKWVEAAAYALALGPNAKIQQQLDEVVRAIEGAQEPDGYLNTFFQLKHPNLKWRNLNTMHEMYCAGHLIEAGVALLESVGDRRLLDVSIRLADHIMSVFGPDKRRGYCGHQEIELALIRLAEATKQPKYAEFARWMIEERGKRPSVFEQELEDAEAMALSPWSFAMLRKKGVYNGDYAQDHAPVREHTEIVGHAVRAMYFYIAATELAGGQKDEDLERALGRIWSNLTKKRMYVTGGIGPSASNEGFTGDYDLPNHTAYAETCAAIGLILWGHKLLELTGDSEYSDIMERALYNGAISGISLAGDHFFYTNPLESRGTHQRVPWFDCACCPPNIARLIGSVQRYVAGVADNAFYLHMPVGLEATASFGGVRTKITVESNYPWSGEFKVHVDPERPVEFTLLLRLPDWADDISTDLPGLERESEFERGYAVFRKTWQPGDVLTVDLGMQPKWIEANPKVREDLGRAALTYGPLVYCAEEHDLGWAPQLFTVDTEAPVEVRSEKLLEGVSTLHVEGMMDVDLFPDQLYAEVGMVESKEATARFVPYYSWCNRGPNHMQVWFRRM